MILDVDLSNFNPLPMILVFAVPFGPAVVVYGLLTLRERRQR